MHARPLVLCLLLATAGCAPMLRQDYVAQAPGGQVVHSSCSFNAHVPVGVRFKVSGIEALVSLARQAGTPYVEVRLDVPEGQTVTLADGRLRIKTSNPDTSSQAEFPFVSLVDGPIVNNLSPLPGMAQHRLAITAPLVGGRIAAGRASSDRHFWLAAQVATQEAEDLWLTLPSFRVNGAEVSLPTIHFHRQAVVAVALINC